MDCTKLNVTMGCNLFLVLIVLKKILELAPIQALIYNPFNLNFGVFCGLDF